MDTPSQRGKGAPLSSTPSMKPSSALPKTPYPLSAIKNSETPMSSAKHHFNTPGIDAISSSPHNELSTDDASSSFAESDESLGIRSGFNLEGSFGRLSSHSGGQDSEGANTSNSNSVPESNNNSPKQANNENEVDILDDSAVPDRGATITEDRGHQVTAPSPSPSIRSYMLEYKNEPRPPSSSGARTPLAMSLSGLRRVDDSQSATNPGDYFPDLPLMSPKLEAIDEVTEEISVREFAFTPDARNTRRETGPSGLRYPAIVQEEDDEDGESNEDDEEDELAHQASLLSILSPLANRTSSSEPAPKKDLDDSLFESPLAIPSSSAHLSFKSGLSPTPGNAALSRSAPAVSGPTAKRRPPALDFSNRRNISGEEAKIKDILWNVNDNEEESEILAPEKEDLGPISPFFVQHSQEDHQIQGSEFLPLPARRGRSGTITHTVENLPPAVRKIPTLVGPNALPYARCPSGIDSFAFDHNNPRPYDAVLPFRSATSTTSNYHGEYEVPSSGRSSESVTPTVTEGLRPVSSFSNTAEYGHSRATSPIQPSPGPFGHAIVSANARARQRTEDKKLLIMKRDQARFEQQGRREAARIARKLREDGNRNTTRDGQAGNEAGNTSMETQIGDEQLQWHFHEEKGGWVKQAIHPVTSAHTGNGYHFSSRLNSTAPPFIPAQRQQPRPGLNASHGYSGAQHSHSQHGPPSHMSSYTPMPSYAEQGIPANRLVQILRERMDSATSSYGSQSGYSLPSLPTPTMPAFNMANPGVLGAIQQTMAISQAIQELSRSNQNLLALMNMQRMANATALAANNGYSMPSAPFASHPPFVPPGFQGSPAPGLSVTQPTPPKAVPSAKLEIKSPVTGARIVHKLEDDPAVVHSYRRTFAAPSTNGSILRSDASHQEIPLGDPFSRPTPVEHTLPTRPAPSQISPKLMGIIPSEKKEGTHIVNTVPKKESRRGDRTSRPVQGRTEEKDRVVRSNAPSPVEMKTPIKLVGRARDLPTPSQVKSDPKSKRTPSSPDAQPKSTPHSAPAREGRVLQEVSRNAQPNKTRPVSPSKGKVVHKPAVDAKDTKPDKQNANVQPAAQAQRVRPNTKHKTVPKAYTGDEAWKAFVQQRMGGMARPASRGPRA